MSDERFNRDLGTVLREIAGEEAPMSVRNRLARITEEAPIGRRLWFSPPMRLATAAAVLVAVVALTILLVPRDTVGPNPTGSPEPSVSSSSASVVPTPSTEPTAAPTSQPTPVVGAWTGLTWAGPEPTALVVSINDAVPWADGYVAVGQIWVDDETSEAAFLTSPDGLRWSVADQFDPGYGRFPRLLVVSDGGLVAFSQQPSPHEWPSVTDRSPLIWRSDDGNSWSTVDSPSWSEILSGVNLTVPPSWDQAQTWSGAGLVDVADGPNGLVAIANSFGDEVVVPVILHSTDARTWTRVDLPTASASAIVSGVAARSDGYVLVGGLDKGPIAGSARPAAWTSTDGANWTPATVEPAPRAGAEFGKVIAGAAGLLAPSNPSVLVAGPAADGGWWWSPDGHRWRMLSQIGADVPSGNIEGDGTRLVALDADASWNPYAGDPWPGLTRGWVSTNGLEWTELAVSGAMTDESTQGWWVVPDGVVVDGMSGAWFAAALAEETS